MKMELEKVNIRYQCNEISGGFDLRREDSNNKSSDLLYVICKLHEILNEKIWDVGDLICSLFNNLDEKSKIRKMIYECIYYGTSDLFEMPDEFVNSIMDILKIPEELFIQHHIDFYIETLLCDYKKEIYYNNVHINLFLDGHFELLCTFIYKISE